MFWIVLGVVLAVAEIFTTTLFLIMFAAGAFAAAAAAGLGASVTVQAAVFAAVSVLSVVAVRPVIRRHHEAEAAGGGETSFGVAAIEGSEALVLEQVDSDHGMVKIDGEVWTARSFDGTEVYEPGDHVRVIKVRGATALVWREGVPGGTAPSGNEA